MHMANSSENDAHLIMGEFEFFRDLVMEANRAAVKLALAAARSEHPLGASYLGMTAEALKALAGLSPERMTAMLHSGIPLFAMRVTERFLSDMTSGPPEAVGQANSERMLDFIGKGRS